MPRTLTARRLRPSRRARASGRGPRSWRRRAPGRRRASGSPRWSRASGKAAPPTETVTFSGSSPSARNGSRRTATQIRSASWAAPSTVVSGQHHDELLAAVARERVDLADLLLDPVRQLAQHRVAAGVPVLVVDLLEVVEVEHQHGERPVEPGGALDLAAPGSSTGSGSSTARSAASVVDSRCASWCSCTLSMAMLAWPARVRRASSSAVVERPAVDPVVEREDADDVAHAAQRHREDVARRRARSAAGSSSAGPEPRRPRTPSPDGTTRPRTRRRVRCRPAPASPASCSPLLGHERASGPVRRSSTTPARACRVTTAVSSTTSSRPSRSCVFVRVSPMRSQADAQVLAALLQRGHVLPQIGGHHVERLAESAGLAVVGRWRDAGVEVALATRSAASVRSVSGWLSPRATTVTRAAATSAPASRMSEEHGGPRPRPPVLRDDHVVHGSPAGRRVDPGRPAARGRPGRRGRAAAATRPLASRRRRAGEHHGAAVEQQDLARPRCGDAGRSSSSLSSRLATTASRRRVCRSTGTRSASDRAVARRTLAVQAGRSCGAVTPGGSRPSSATTVAVGAEDGGVVAYRAAPRWSTAAWGGRWPATAPPRCGDRPSSGSCPSAGCARPPAAL